MAKKEASVKENPARTDVESFVEAVVSGKNVKASRRLEKILREKTKSRIAEVLGD